MDFCPRSPRCDDRGVQTCVECGASAGTSCAELFEHLLALDHSRKEPWGPLHGIVVACYRLQHPSTVTGGSRHVLLDLIRAYREGGLAAAQRWTAGARRANSHRRNGQPHPRYPPQDSQQPRAPHAREVSGLGAGSPGPPDPAAAHEPQSPGHRNAFAVTIADVSVDGTFPGEGYSARVDSWVEATLQAWGP